MRKNNSQELEKAMAWIINDLPFSLFQNEIYHIGIYDCLDSPQQNENGNFQFSVAFQNKQKVSAYPLALDKVISLLKESVGRLIKSAQVNEDILKKLEAAIINLGKAEVGDSISTPIFDTTYHLDREPKHKESEIEPRRRQEEENSPGEKSPPPSNSPVEDESCTDETRLKKRSMPHVLDKGTTNLFYFEEEPDKKNNHKSYIISCRHSISKPEDHQVLFNRVGGKKYFPVEILKLFKYFELPDVSISSGILEDLQLDLGFNLKKVKPAPLSNLKFCPYSTKRNVVFNGITSTTGKSSIAWFKNIRANIGGKDLKNLFAIKKSAERGDSGSPVLNCHDKEASLYGLVVGNGIHTTGEPGRPSDFDVTYCSEYDIIKKHSVFKNLEKTCNGPFIIVQ